MDINKNVVSCRYILYIFYLKKKKEEEVIESLGFNARNNQLMMKRKCNIGLGV